MKRWYLGIAALALLAVITALVLRNTTSGRVFPQLEVQLDSVVQVEILSAKSRITLDRVEDGNWKISTAADLPAKRADVRNFLLALSAATKLDEKSADATRFAEMGLDSQETLVSLRTANTTSLASLSLGKPAAPPAVPDDHAGPVALSYFARLSTGGAAFILSPIPELPQDAADWADIKLPAIKATEITEFNLTTADLKSVKLSQSAGSAPALLDIQKPETFNEARAADVFASLQAIEPLDIAEANQINWFNAGTFYLRTASGLIVTGQVISRQGEAWLRMNGSADPSASSYTQSKALELNKVRALAIKIASEKAALLLSNRADFIVAD
jgi:hypothetical protein